MGSKIVSGLKVYLAEYPLNRENNKPHGVRLDWIIDMNLTISNASGGDTPRRTSHLQRIPTLDAQPDRIARKQQLKPQSGTCY